MARRKYGKWNMAGANEGATDPAFEDALAHENRLIRPDGSFDVERTGASAFDLYSQLLQMRLSHFLLFWLAFFILVNVFFAFLFMIVGIDSLEGSHPGSAIDNFLQAFFFSIQSFTTVGYGHISPHGLAANSIAALDSFIGLMTFALATGLFFARFSRPDPQIGFSKQLLITPHEHDQSLQFRIVNLRSAKIIDVQARVTMTWLEKIDGRFRRRFALLPLERDIIYMFPVNWTIVHHIDDASPLRHWTLSDIRQKSVEFMILIRGYDETYLKSIHVSKSYNCEDLKEGFRFKSMYTVEKNKTILHLDEIDAIETV